jgi:signal transduction histidine kinase/ActR/RegA family two-component response regulator
VSSGDEGMPDARLLLLAPTHRDASTTRTLLSAAGVLVETCSTFDALVREIERGAAAIVLPEEALSPDHNATLCAVLDRQAPWSDLPVLVLTRSGADSDELAEAVRTLGNVTLLERPLRVATLLSAVRTAVRARSRQYQIREHLVERARAEESLRIADERKDEFLATLGHELRNPLAPLVTGLKVLSLAKLQDPVAVRVLAIMERQTGHLIRLVDDLLEVSRITRGLIEVRREPLDLGLVVRSAIETSRPAIESARHELSLDLPVEPITIAGDAVRLTQVFANLLTNAAKYTNNGGHIWLTVTRQADRALILVRDNGIGIPEAQLNAVFDMFTQVDRSNRAAQGGLGIGLTLVRSLVALHGGRVEATSAGIGAGSEFRVELPILAVRRPEAEGAGVARSFPPRRVLVVDDNCDAADTLGVLLAALGATVSIVHSGRAALESLDSFRPDAVLLDIGMPEMDGYEVSRRIRGTSGHGGILLIALTGWGQEHDQRASRAAGIDHHLVKPPDIDRLRELLAAGWSSGLVPDAGSARGQRRA